MSDAYDMIRDGRAIRAARDAQDLRCAQPSQDRPLLLNDAMAGAAGIGQFVQPRPPFEQGRNSTFCRDSAARVTPQAPPVDMDRSS